MSTSSQQDRNFINDVIPGDLLESAIEWVKSNLDIDIVYDRKAIIEWVAEMDDPSEVFTEQRLRAWALENGFAEAED